MRKTISCILIILMGVQIVLGIMYAAANLCSIQPFSENMALPFPAGLLYLMQIAAFCAALWYFLGKAGLRKGKLLRGFITAFLVTVPFLLQMHMAKLGCSGALSAFLWLLGLAVEIRNCGLSRKRGCLLGISYFLYGILCPDGVWLGGILLLAVPVLYQKGKKCRESTGRKEGIYYRLLVLFMACVILMANMGLNGMWPEKRQEYLYKGFGHTMVMRFVWPNFSTNYFFWNEDVKQVLSLEDAVDIGNREDAAERDFFPVMEEKYGKRRANLLYLEMAYRCFADRTKEIAEEIATDFKDYLLLPFTIERNLQGEGTSLTAWNYGRMKVHTPLLVKYYFHYGLFELPVLLLGSILLWLAGAEFPHGRRLLREKAIGDNISDGGKHLVPPEWKVLLFAGLLYVFWYTMRSNLPIDYKQVLPVLLVWYLAPVCSLKETVSGLCSRVLHG